jgi:hypothetical protein
VSFFFQCLERFQFAYLFFNFELYKRKTCTNITLFNYAGRGCTTLLSDQQQKQKNNRLEKNNSPNRVLAEEKRETVIERKKTTVP